MKNMLVMCGAGHATSTVVHSKIDDWLEKNGLDNDVKITQSAVSAEIENIANNKYDIVVSTTIVPDSIKSKVINGVALLTGIGADQVFAKIKSEIEG